MRKLYIVNHLSYSSDRKLRCSPLFLENCEILEKIGTKPYETEKLRNAVKLSDTRWNCESWDVCYYETRLIHLKKFLIIAQLDIILYLKSRLDSSLFLFFQCFFHVNCTLVKRDSSLFLFFQCFFHVNCTLVKSR